jgi:hypothetical protein
VPDLQLVELLVKNEIARRVTQMYVLERLSRLDVATARDMLASLVPALERLSKVCPCGKIPLNWTRDTLESNGRYARRTPRSDSALRVSGTQLVLPPGARTVSHSDGF